MRSLSIAGIWSCPNATGERPRPCLATAFTAVDDRRAVVFGGENGKQDCMNDVYIIDLQVMNWSKLNKSEDGPWPEERGGHAACCLNYGQRFPQLLVTGGLDRVQQPLADAWILDVDRGTWRKIVALHAWAPMKLVVAFLSCVGESYSESSCWSHPYCLQSWSNTDRGSRVWRIP
jgi:hypothetical protein